MLSALIVATSCTKDEYVPFPTPEEVSFVNDIQPFFNTKCTGCHGNTPPNLEFPDSYDNLINGGYIDINNPAESKLYKSIESGTMQSYSTPTQTAMVLKWIEQGAKNN